MIQEVVMRAVDWSLLTDSIFGDPNLIVVLYPESEDAKIIDNYALEFNPELANDILYQTEYDAGFELSLFYNKNQSNMDLIAEGIADSLWELNIDITLIETQNEYEFMEKEESLVAERKDLNALMIWLFSANDAD